MTTMKYLLAAVIVAAPAAALAGSNVWSRALESSDAELARRTYEENMEKGDEYAMRASSTATSSSAKRELVRRAMMAYELAVQARPDQAEPHFRAGNLLHAAAIDCNVRTTMCQPGPHKDPGEMRRVLAHWDAFERLAPLDPRIDDRFLFERALLHTRLGIGTDGAAQVEAAIKDYQTLIDRGDFAEGGRSDWGVILSNLAETHMMIGHLDQAIEGYRDALRYRQGTAHYYGLAVALDRDEQGAQAREIMAALGRGAYEAFQADVTSFQTFYVPEGEKYYYFALGAESLGLVDEAIHLWEEFLQSGASPQYQARAKANRDALIARRARGKS